MKLRTKRLLSIGLAAAMTVGLLAGCGKKGGSDNGGSDEDGITTLNGICPSTRWQQIQIR